MVLVMVAVSMNQATQANVPAEEREVLMEFYAATGGERWSNHSGWGTVSSACDWYGVTFIEGDVSRPVVAGLTVALNNLEGTLPATLADLLHLRTLSVSGNRLSGMVPEAILERSDRHQFEFDGRGNAFSNLIVRATVEYSASGVLCSASEDVRYHVELDEPRNRATFQSVECTSARSRDTYCLVREGQSPSLFRLSRSLKMLGFSAFRSRYDYPFTIGTHGVYLTTAAVWGDTSNHTVQTYSEQGPIEVWTAQQLFLGLLSEIGWERESRRTKCDFQK